MSWSVSACGPAPKVAEQLEQQFANINVTDPAEMESVQTVRKLVAQALSPFDPDYPVRVMASGSQSWRDWSKKIGWYQSIDLKVEPIHFSTT